MTLTCVINRVIIIIKWLHLNTAVTVLQTHKMLSTYWLPKNATSNQNARPWMVPACEITNDNGISMLCKSDSCAVWKLTVYFSDRAKQMRISKVSWRRSVAGPLQWVKTSTFTTSITNFRLIWKQYCAHTVLRVKTVELVDQIHWVVIAAVNYQWSSYHDRLFKILLHGGFS